MTFRDHPTDWMGNPDGRDYHYRFRMDDSEAQKYLKFARWKGRMIDMYPRDMKHLRTKIDHVTLRTYDHMGHIKGMKEYAISPNWEKVPYSRGKKEMTNANGGGTKIREETYTGEEYGTINVEYHIDATPTEIKDAFENGVNEAEISHKMQEARYWAVEERIDEINEARWKAQRECKHHHVVKEGSGNLLGYCEDCHREFRDEAELNAVA